MKKGTIVRIKKEYWDGPGDNVLFIVIDDRSPRALIQPLEWKHGPLVPQESVQNYMIYAVKKNCGRRKNPVVRTGYWESEWRPGPKTFPAVPGLKKNFDSSNVGYNAYDPYRIEIETRSGPGTLGLDVYTWGKRPDMSFPARKLLFTVPHKKIKNKMDIKQMVQQANRRAAVIIIKANQNIEKMPGTWA